MRFNPLRNSKSEMFEVVDQEGHLCGLIEKIEGEARWKIQLMRKLVHFEATREQAFAYCRGVEHTLDALGREMAIASAHQRRRLSRVG